MKVGKIYVYMANGWMNLLDVAAECKEGRIYEVKMMKKEGS